MRLLLFVLAFQLAACSPSGRQESTLSGSQPQITQSTEGPFQIAEPDPVHVQTVLDTEWAVTEIIPVEGGTITAEAADGSRFTLTIPPDALLSDQSITLTPLLGVEGEAGSGFVAGVEVAPHGLQLYAPATLVIAPAEPIEPAEEISFAVHGSSQELVLFPLLPQAGDATFAITHFSSYYLGAGGLSTIQAVLQGTPTRIEDQFMQQVQELINHQRQAQLQEQEGDPNYRATLSAYLLAYYRQVLVPHIRAAEISDDWRFICQVIGEVIGFERTLQMEEIELDIDFDYAAVLQRLLEIEAPLLLDYSHELCGDGFVIQAWTVMLRVARSQDIAGRSFGVDIQEWQTNCPAPQLSFSSQIVGMYHDANIDRLVSDVSVESVVPLRYNPNQRGFEGEGVLHIEVAAAGSLNGIAGDAMSENSWCKVSWAPEDSILIVDKLVVNLNHPECATAEEAEATFGKPELELVIKMGTPLENYSEDCSNVSLFSPPQERDPVFGPKRWALYFRPMHRDNYNEETQTFRFTEWDFDTSKAVAFVQVQPGCLMHVTGGEVPCPDTEPDFWAFHIEESIAIALHK